MMGVLTANAYLAVLVPLLASAAVGVFGRRSMQLSCWGALAGSVSVLAVGVACVLEPAGRRSVSLGWLASSSGELTIGWHADGLAAIMLVVVGVVASAVVVFSLGYMRRDPDPGRYFALIALFTASMSALVLADSLVTLFVGWELVGACSYLLIGFWYDKPSAADAARKAFIVTRVGDAGFMLGLAVLWGATGTLAIPEVLGRVAALPASTATVAALLLFAGAAGKSAQFPLHVWLPDAMEGPTPVSALIHAATMVAAGVFLVARMWPLFAASPAALQVVLVIGCVTALGAATIAVTQTDIKKVLAYSTISQLGFMFAALGSGAWVAAVFHLVTHAAFKSLLFLASGSVIHGSGTQDLRDMGGLWRKMPLTAGTWMVGVLALAGIPPLAGFFSKDAVIGAVMQRSVPAGAALVAASLLTGLYAFRATQLAFFGRWRGDVQDVAESPAVMTAPLLALAVAAAASGAAAGPVSRLLGAEAEPLSIPIAVMSVVAALIGCLIGSGVWGRDAGVENALPRWLERWWMAARSGYGIDDLYRRVVVRPVIGVAAISYVLVERVIIDGIVEGIGRATRRLGHGAAELQNGDPQRYAAWIAVGAIAAVAVTVWLGR